MRGPSDVASHDCELVDLRSGSRTKLGKGLHEGVVVPSVTGRYLAYYTERNWWVLDTQNGTRRNLTGRLGSSFDAGRSLESGAGGPVRKVDWRGRDERLIVHDIVDAWLLRPDGSAPRRLTRGREQGRRYRLVGAWQLWPGLQRRVVLLSCD